MVACSLGLSGREESGFFHGRSVHRRPCLRWAGRWWRCRPAAAACLLASALSRSLDVSLQDFKSSVGRAGFSGHHRQPFSGGISAR